jgi:hypothetical protein
MMYVTAPFSPLSGDSGPKMPLMDRAFFASEAYGDVPEARIFIRRPYKTM